MKHLRAKHFYAWLVSEPIAPVVAALAVYFGVFAISWTASMIMNSMILYYRYLFVAIGPLLFAAAAVLSHVHTKLLVAGVVAVTLCASVANQALLLRDDYDPANNVPIEKFRETVDSVSEQIGGQMPLVVSTDIGYMGVTACMCEDVPQTYMDWQKGNWDRAYMAYSPTLVSKKSWESHLRQLPRHLYLHWSGAKRQPAARHLRPVAKRRLHAAGISHVLPSVRANVDDHRRDDEAVEAAARLPARQTHCGKDEALQLLAAQHRELEPLLVGADHPQPHD